MLKRERVLVWSLGLFLFVLTFSFTLYKFRTPPAPGIEAPGSQSTVLVEGSETVVHYLLPDGRVAKTEVGATTAELIGLGIDGVAVLRPQWSIVSFAPERVVASRPCPSVEGGAGFLRGVDGKVGIFAGDAGGCHTLIELTDIEVDDLPAGVRQALDEGVPFRDESDLPQVLDGMRSST